MPNQQANDLIQELGSAILSDENYEEGWESIALVIELNDGHCRLSGFTYDENGAPTSQIPEDDDPITDAASALQAEMTKSAGDTWKSALVQITNPEEPGITIEFDYDGDKWRITSKNVEQMSKTLRPQ